VPFLMLWGGLALGAVVGALAFVAVGIAALWFAAAAAALLALAAHRLDRPGRSQ
jgi:uncharacterized membrane protein YoaK (UPF0700 family)